MRKYILPVLVLALLPRAASASGLYLSAGYSRPSSSFESKQPLPAPGNFYNAISATCPDCWQYNFADDTYASQHVNYWPDSDEGDDLGIVEWDNKTIGTMSFHPKDKNAYIYAIGWDFGGTPFRIELEQSKTSFSSDGFSLTMPQSCAAGNLANCSNGWGSPDDDPVVGDYYTFSLNGYQGGFMNATISNIMINTYFVLPFFGNFDPYVGVGIGKTKINTKFNGYSGGTGSENSVQFMLGCEYWIPDTSWIVGLEYRMLNVSDRQEIDDPNNYMTMSQRSIVFKLRYDFMSDDF